MKYVIYDKYTSKIVVVCSGVFRLAKLQVKAGQSLFQTENHVDDTTQKVEFDGLDETGQPINPTIVNKTPEEIVADNPPVPEMPENKRLAHITNEQWQDTLKRLDTLEKTDDTK